MGEHAFRADAVSRRDVAAEPDHGVDLHSRKIGIAVVMAGVSDLVPIEEELTSLSPCQDRDAGMPSRVRSRRPGA